MINRLYFFFILGGLLAPPISSLGQSHPNAGEEYTIVWSEDSTILIRAGILSRTLALQPRGVYTSSIKVNGKEMLDQPLRDATFVLSEAIPNQEPQGARESELGMIRQENTKATWTDMLNITEEDSIFQERTRWRSIFAFDSSTWDQSLGEWQASITHPTGNSTRLIIRYRDYTYPALRDVYLKTVYEVYQGFPAIRKWVEVGNNSGNWYKVDHLSLDPLRLASRFRYTTDLTPSENGAASSIRSFSNQKQETGLIAVSEIPSALRAMSDQGAMGYNPELFEWVIGPAEQFVSEPVFLFAFDGKVQLTISRPSTPLDRTVERPFKQFLYEVVGVKKPDIRQFTPLWCSWTNFGARINDSNIREMAGLASEIGVKTLLVDAGWYESQNPDAIAGYSMEPDENKFPAFAQTCRYVRNRGLQLGIWVSNYRHPDYAKDLQVFPEGYSLPKVEREGSLAMSYASQWRYYYAQDLIRLHDQYGATYFKQDLTNIRFGDIARGHPSRTRKESILRGVRGLFESQDMVLQSAPNVLLELTHEIYWGTPGVPCDVAALKHAHTFHIPPNDYSGVGHRKQRVQAEWGAHPKYHPDTLQAQLLQGCMNARTQFYAHRGLPLPSIEYYGAATVNFNGSLTPEVQRRQVCSWLMGAPSVYAGDLASLTEENKKVYRESFALLERLDKNYRIYQHFQFSGVPEPTDTDWHWWGKLNEEGYGAVVVLRGSEGKDRRSVNIPWVQSDRKYQVTRSFTQEGYGLYTGEELINGRLELSLNSFEQEILEIRPVTN